MKIITYLIALIGIIAAAWFSYELKGKFADLKVQKDALAEKNANKLNTINKRKDEAKEAKANIDAARTALADTQAEVSSKTDNFNLVDRQLTEWNEKSSEQSDRLDEVNTLVTTVKQNFDELNIELEEIPDHISELETNIAESNEKLEEITLLTSAAQKSYDKNSAQLSDLRERVARRANNIRSNSLSGHIDSVNNDWGFVIVHVPSKMPIDTSSKLIVQRGSSYVGKLKISAIEGTLITADIDHKSLSPGMVIQAGDSVILAKPVTN